MTPCSCKEPHQGRIVLTGGPGAGKTAVLELVRQSFCQHVAVLPESASILFGGGFPRKNADLYRRAAQRSIFYIQQQLEGCFEGSNVVSLCDRGTVDGVAYWPGDPEELWRVMNTTRQEQLSRYDTVIHLRTPRADNGYNHKNILRTETAAEAAVIDERIVAAWEGHPRRFFVESSGLFMNKASDALVLIRAALPACCRLHPVPSVDNEQSEP